MNSIKNERKRTDKGENEGGKRYNRKKKKKKKRKKERTGIVVLFDIVAACVQLYIFADRLYLVSYIHVFVSHLFLAQPQ